MSPVEKEQSKISIPVHLRGRHDVITQGNSLITMKIAKNINRGISSDFSLGKKISTCTTCLYLSTVFPTLKSVYIWHLKNTAYALSIIRKRYFINKGYTFTYIYMYTCVCISYVTIVYNKTLFTI